MTDIFEQAANKIAMEGQGLGDTANQTPSPSQNQPLDNDPFVQAAQSIQMQAQPQPQRDESFWESTKREVENIVDYVPKIPSPIDAAKYVGRKLKQDVQFLGTRQQPPEQAAEVFKK